MKWNYRVGVLGLLLLLVLGGSEAICRWGLGLGDPPLSVPHPTIEYLFRPSAEYERLGNRIAYNEYSMRSPSFSRSKTRPKELRVLALGDSVLNGGSLTDQSELATELLRTRLSELARCLPGKTLDLRRLLRASLQAGQQPYRDDIRLLVDVQAVLADVMTATVLLGSHVSTRVTTTGHHRLVGDVQAKV